MNLGNQVKQVMMCIEQKVYFDKKNKFFPKSLQVSGFCCTFALAKHDTMKCRMGDDDARNNIGHYLCQYFRDLPEVSLHH